LRNLLPKAVIFAAFIPNYLNYTMAQKKKKYNISPNIEARDGHVIAAKTGNLYESLAVISRRSRQISVAQKEELHNKLHEFASSIDSLEEVHENKEQIEISRYYERMPHPTLLAYEEFMGDKITHRYGTNEEREQYYNRNRRDNRKKR